MPCTFAFRGTDDMWDWLSNSRGIYQQSSVNGVNFHSGFVDEFDKADVWLKHQECGNESVWIGHSLGGAIATIAGHKYGGRVVTFGAPQLYDNNEGCAIGGNERYFHAHDPISGEMFGLNAQYWHAQSGWKYDCVDWGHWYQRCEQWAWVEQGCQENSGWFSVNVFAHSMGDMYDLNMYQE